MKDFGYSTPMALLYEAFTMAVIWGIIFRYSDAIDALGLPLSVIVYFIVFFLSAVISALIIFFVVRAAAKTERDIKKL
jgi:hypothetical protein